MKKFILICMIGVLFFGCEKNTNDLVISNASNMNLKTNSQVAVCHKSGNNRTVINININSWPAHEAHGDAIDMDGDGYFDRVCGCSDLDPDDNNPEVYPGAPCIITTKLIANGPNYDTECIGLHMGTISVVNDSNFITVTYDVLSEGWLLKATQLYIGPESDIPSNKPGDPILGQFPYNHVHDSGVSSFTVGPIYISESSYVIAAHADAERIVSVSTVDSLCEYLPETVDFSSSGIGPDCYLNIDVINGSWLDGTYLGWCVDLDEFIGFGSVYEDADVYCTINPLPDDVVDHPENIDLINWILNNITLGEVSACGGNFTFGDIQKAIWDLVDDEVAGTALLGDWSQCRADEIISMAMANGEGFIPEVGEYLGIILDAEGVQTVLISVPFTSHISLGVSSAWGYGQNGEYCDPDGATGISFSDSPYYGGSSWGWYFYGCD